MGMGRQNLRFLNLLEMNIQCLSKTSLHSASKNGCGKSCKTHFLWEVYHFLWKAHGFATIIQQHLQVWYPIDRTVIQQRYLHEQRDFPWHHFYQSRVISGGLHLIYFVHFVFVTQHGELG